MKNKKKILMDLLKKYEIVAAIWLVMTGVLLINQKIEEKNYPIYQYKEISLEEFETEEFRKQYTEGLDETKNNINTAYKKLEDMQKKASKAKNRAVLINNLLKELGETLEYDVSYSGSHADALIEGKGKCYHYAYLFYLLADSFDFETEVLYGKYKDGRYHVWNRIWYENQWYYFDPTGADKNRKMYSWLSESQIQKLLGNDEYRIVYSRTVKNAKEKAQ